jgi:hypothetical protein
MNEIDRILDGMAESFRQQLRSPILHDPSEEAMDYEDVATLYTGHGPKHDVRWSVMLS